jgi:hypothetical protein
VTNAVLVVELALGDSVVDVDGREQELASSKELIKPVNAGGGLLGDPMISWTLRVQLVGSLGQ